MTRARSAMPFSTGSRSHLWRRYTHCPSCDRRQASRRSRLSGDPTGAGVGPVLAAVFVAEIGDVHRFADARLCSWAGLTPQHRESDTVVRRGHITKQGSKLVRWAAVEAIQRQPDTPKSPSTANGSRPAAAGTSPRSPRPASCSPSSTTGCATDTSGPGPPSGGGVSISDATRARPLNSLAPESAWSPF